MTQVNFYILDDQTKGDRYQLACRITDKAWQSGRRVYLNTNSKAESRHIDRLLWTFREGSFLPHGILGESDQTVTPIIIGNDGDAADEHDVLINLANEVPLFFSRFERVAEFIDNDPGIRKSGRDRYRLYRNQGYILNTYNVDR